MATQRLQVNISDGSSYDIRVGAGLLGSLGAHLRAVSDAQRAVVITDSNVGSLYLEKVRGSLGAEGFEVFDLTIPAGEGSKSIPVASELWEAMQMLGVGRDGVVVALGGGVVGDVAGFVASTWMRGVPCVQVPTSLLAMVDSSIGGKTAVNIAAGKNLVGTFAQPLYVTADVETLATLPSAEWDNGFAEIAKSALLAGGDFYTWLCANATELVKHEPSAVQQAIVKSLAFKATVVANDAMEKGERECLNYGHTFAHALETASGFSISHGRAVAEGMRFASLLAVEAIDAPAGFAGEQEVLLKHLGLTSLRESFAADELFEGMLSDKKVRDGAVRFVFATSPGEWRTVAVDPDLIMIYLILWEQARM